VTWFFLYESVSLSLENVDQMHGEPGLKPWRSKEWTPPGYHTRMKRDEGYWTRRKEATSSAGGVTAGLGGGYDEADVDVDVDDRTTAVPSGRPSRAVEHEDGGVGTGAGKRSSKHSAGAEAEEEWREKATGRETV
jgi:SP family sugar:H+ symporter-like MFS transporter